MASQGKNKAAVNKEEDSENWCFVCKDGGDLRICDYKQCVKSYHPECVGQKDSFLESEKKWDCPWHRCFRCRKSSYLHCYTCTNATCRHCLPDAEILRVKGMYGFCEECLKLALLIEEKREYDSDGGHVDFTDQETEEGLFMEYYTIIKDNEGFELIDICAAKESVAAKKNDQPESGSDDFDLEKEEQVSDYSDMEGDKSKHQKRRKRSNGRKPGRPNKKEFIGWASRSLIEFLNSIGESTAKKLSQDDVTSIVHDYAKKNKLLHTEKRKVIMCDAQLQSLFKKKTINRLSVYDHLEDHFAEDQNELEEDKVGYVLEANNEVGTINACKRQRKTEVEKKNQAKEAEKNVVPVECRFASLVLENFKLVYLKRIFLTEMLKEPQSFEEKVTGCFVMVKLEKFQLIQVKGVKTLSTDVAETVLLLSSEPTEIKVSLLSNTNLQELEMYVLRRKMLAGEIERPTVEYLQQKVRSIHKDITTVMVRQELNGMDSYIDHVNVLGRRYHLRECWERKRALESGLEYARRLQNVPTVIPDVYNPATDCNSGGIKNYKKSDEGSPESIPPPDSVRSDDHQDKNKPEENAQHGVHASASEKRETTAETPTPAPAEPQKCRTPESEMKRIDVIDIMSEDEGESAASPPAPAETNPEDEVWCVKGPAGERNKSDLCLLRQWSSSSSYAAKFMAWKEDWREEDAIPLLEALSTASSKR